VKRKLEKDRTREGQKKRKPQRVLEKRGDRQTEEDKGKQPKEL
jgi:hypothetical protein